MLKPEENQRRLREYIRVLRKNQNNDVYNLYIKYFIIIHNFLYLENEHYNLVKECGKEINKYLVLPELKLNDIIKKFEELYDNEYSMVRFSVETFYSIEEIRIRLKNNPEFYGDNLIKI